MLQNLGNFSFKIASLITIDTNFLYFLHPSDSVLGSGIYKKILRTGDQKGMENRGGKLESVDILRIQTVFSKVAFNFLMARCLMI